MTQPKMTIITKFLNIYNATLFIVIITNGTNQRQAQVIEEYKIH